MNNKYIDIIQYIGTISPHSMRIEWTFIILDL